MEDWTWGSSYRNRLGNQWKSHPDDPHFTTSVSILGLVNLTAKRSILTVAVFACFWHPFFPNCRVHEILHISIFSLLHWLEGVLRGRRRRWCPQHHGPQHQPHRGLPHQGAHPKWGGFLHRFVDKTLGEALVARSLKVAGKHKVATRQPIRKQGPFFVFKLVCLCLVLSGYYRHK